MTAIRFLFFFNAISVLYALEGDSKEPDFDMPGFGDNLCPSFRCSTGHVAVPKSRAKYTSFGCEAMGGGMMVMAQPGGPEAFSPCCDLWHACYQTCGSPKKLCDESFKTCSANACGADEECKKSANLKGMMLGFAGCEKYDQAQRSSCECTSKDTAEGKRLDALNYFYKSHAPDGQGKASTLVKKVDTTAKMAALMRKLLAKYPKAIKIQKDPQQNMQQEMMDRMMRKERADKRKEDTKVTKDDVDNFNDSDEKIEL